MIVKVFIEVDKVIREGGEGISLQDAFAHNKPRNFGRGIANIHSMMDSGDYLIPAGLYDVDTSPHQSDAISFNSRIEADMHISGLSAVDTNWRRTGKTVLYGFKVVRVEFKYANMHGWSDVHPYEIVRVISDKTVVVREMVAEKDPEFKPEFIPGGFAGHCTNQSEQTYTYKSCDDGHLMKIRLGKKGWKSQMGRHFLSTEPRKFYDYNF